MIPIAAGGALGIGGFVVGYIVKAFGASATLQRIEGELTKAEMALANFAPTVKELIANIRQHL